MSARERAEEKRQQQEQAAHEAPLSLPVRLDVVAQDRSSRPVIADGRAGEARAS
jgi:hypothetical protein